MKDINFINHENRLKNLLDNSNYQSNYDWSVYYNFLKNHKLRISSSDGIQMINSFIGCESCHVGFQLDTYLEGCTHDCLYCYAKHEGEAKNQWNNPIPVPLDISLIWEQLYLTFEADSKDHKLFHFLNKRVPLRLGSLSDPFIGIERKLGISLELIKMLNHYNYPYLIVTRSHLIADDQVLNTLNKDLASIHISIPSLDEAKTKVLEPRAPSPQKRLDSLRVLNENKIWTTARINPLFPIVKDGEFSSDSFSNEHFTFYSDDLIKEIADTGCKSILAGMVTMKSDIVDELSTKLDFNLRSLMKDESSGKDFYISKEENRKYFQHMHRVSRNLKLDFSTCYLGQTSEQYKTNQDLWSNKKDCCNSVDKVKEHKITSTDISREKHIQTNSEQGFLHRIILKLLLYLIREINKK